MFITFEANEGAGKSTQARLLAERLRREGHDVVLTREPGGSLLAEQIRDLLVKGEPGRMSATTELLLFTAARRDHIEKTIQPALDRGAIVVCDRYLGSTYALQGAGGMDLRKIDILFDEFCALRPDLTLFIDIPVEASLERTKTRLGAAASVENRFEAKGIEFHRRVSANFQRQCDENAEWIRIEGERSIDEIHEDIHATVLARLGELGRKALDLTVAA